jgi:hypothetical protein
MKLLQYRFTADDVNESSYVGHEIKSFFSAAKDLNLNAIISSTARRGGVKRKSLRSHDLSIVIAQSFEQSYLLNNIDYDKFISIKSMESCRFVVFENDGLLRICYSNEDSVIEFGKLRPELTDSSCLLTETDLFDFM